MERHDRRHNIVNGKILQELRGKFLALKNPEKKQQKREIFLMMNFTQRPLRFNQSGGWGSLALVGSPPRRRKTPNKNQSEGFKYQVDV